MRFLRTVAMVLFIGSAFTQGCGGDSDTGTQQEPDVVADDVKTLVCGEGTVEVNGFCVPEAGDDVVVPPDTASEDVVEEDVEVPPTLQCGPGTKEVDGVCVLDEDYLNEMLKPEIASVAVKSLTISEDGIRSIYPMHAMGASITLDVETFDELDTVVVLGLENQDGSKRCVAGYWTLKAMGRVEKDDAEPVQSFTLQEEFYVQPSCDVLVGQSNVKAWVSFDPFDHTNVAGRTITPDENMSVTDFLQQSRLSLDECKSGSPDHLDSCETALTVEASPGKDVVLTGSNLSSTVAVLEIPGFVPTYTETSVTDEEGNIVEMEQPKPIEQLSNTPHFIVNADMKVFGLDGTEEEEIEDGSLSLKFAIRPLLDPDQEVDLPPEALDWLPLYAEIQDEPKAGEEPTINYLEQEFMKSMVGGQVLVRTSPIFISGDTELQIAKGMWSDFDQFEVRVCVEADFAENGVAEDATGNNCVITPVVVLRKDITSSPSLEDNEDAATYTDGIKLGQTFGNVEKVGIKFTLQGLLTSASDGVAAGALLGTYLKGWFELTLFEAVLNGWDYYDAGKADKIIPSLTIFGLNFPAQQKDFKSGDNDIAGISYTISGPGIRYGFDLGIVFIGVEAHVEGTIGVGAYLTKEAMAAGGNNSKCTATGAVIVGDYCVKVFNVTKNRKDAEEACRSDVGWLASPMSMDVVNAILQSRTASGASNAYLWIDGGIACSAVEMATMEEAICDMFLNMPLIPQDKKEEIYNKCMADAESKVAWCIAERADLRKWRFYMPQMGDIEMSGVSFNTGEPNDFGQGEKVIALKSNGKLADFGAGSKLPYACMYPKSYTAGGKVSATVEPYATLTLVGSAGISLLLVGADLWVAIDLLTAALPLTGSIQWMTGTPILTLATGTLEFVLRGLGGAIGATLWAKPGGSWTIEIFSWDSIDYGRWLLGSLVPRWRSQ